MSYLENHGDGERLIPASSYRDGETEVQRSNMNYPGSDTWWQSHAKTQCLNFPVKWYSP